MIHTLPGRLLSFAASRSLFTRLMDSDIASLFDVRTIRPDGNDDTPVYLMQIHARQIRALCDQLLKADEDYHFAN